MWIFVSCVKKSVNLEEMFMVRILSIVFRTGFALNKMDPKALFLHVFFQNEEDCNLACPVCLELLKPPLRFVQPFSKFQDINFFIYLLSFYEFHFPHNITA